MFFQAVPSELAALFITLRAVTLTAVITCACMRHALHRRKATHVGCVAGQGGIHPSTDGRQARARVRQARCVKSCEASTTTVLLFSCRRAHPQPQPQPHGDSQHNTTATARITCAPLAPCILERTRAHCAILPLAREGKPMHRLIRAYRQALHVGGTGKLVSVFVNRRAAYNNNQHKPRPPHTHRLRPLPSTAGCAQGHTRTRHGQTSPKLCCHAPCCDDGKECGHTQDLPSASPRKRTRRKCCCHKGDTKLFTPCGGRTAQGTTTSSNAII
jgi:hypothetical protein